MSKRGEFARRPTTRGEWKLRLGDRSAANGWEELCQQQPGPMATLYDELTGNPGTSTNRAKRGPLKGSLSTAQIGGAELPQWQAELAKGARVWYAIDEHSMTVWITVATNRHRNETK